MAAVGVRGRSRDEAGSVDRRQQYGEALHFREVAHCLPPLVGRSLRCECAQHHRRVIEPRFERFPVFVEVDLDAPDLGWVEFYVLPPERVEQFPDRIYLLEVLSEHLVGALAAVNQARLLQCLGGVAHSEGEPLPEVVRDWAGDGDGAHGRFLL